MGHMGHRRRTWAPRHRRAVRQGLLVDSCPWGTWQASSVCVPKATGQGRDFHTSTPIVVIYLLDHGPVLVGREAPGPPAAQRACIVAQAGPEADDRHAIF